MEPISNPARYALFVLTRESHEDPESEAVVESKPGQTFEDACDDFELYKEIYGPECAIVVRETVSNDPVMYAFPTLRWASNVDPMYKPYTHVPASLCIGLDVYPGSIVAVLLNGREIHFASNGRGAITRLTVRKDGLYREKGTDKGAYCRFGIAESHRSLEV
jgi:hypothetical protein